jgi:hypothetical protein
VSTWNFVDSIVTARPRHQERRTSRVSKGGWKRTPSRTIHPQGHFDGEKAQQTRELARQLLRIRFRRF